MNGTGSSRERGFDALLFDMDGVLLDSARLHAAAWKQTFDPLLMRLAERRGESFEPFDADRDYRLYVDGKHRLDGVRDFLRSREIELPEGEPGEPGERDTVQGVAHRKDARFGECSRQGVSVYPDTRPCLTKLRARGLRLAVVSASHHCAELLEAASLASLFDARVDGVDADRLGLAGKPEPDGFLEAARRLGVRPERAVVVEDALAGVRAGRAGGFGCVVGVSRSGEDSGLAAAGADRVISDLGELCS